MGTDGLICYLYVPSVHVYERPYKTVIKPISTICFSYCSDIFLFPFNLCLFNPLMNKTYI